MALHLLLLPINAVRLIREVRMSRAAVPALSAVVSDR
jgi:hypothetical protein